MPRNNIIELVDSCRPAYGELKRVIHTTNLVLISGPQSVGKRTIIKKVFQDDDSILHAYVNCYSVLTPGKFYSALCQEFQSKMNILKSTMGKIKLPEIGKLVSCRDFAVYFSEYLSFANKKHIKRLYIVLDHVEVLQKTNLMSCFTSLTTIPNLSIILTSYELPTDIVHYAIRASKTAGLRIQDRMHLVVARTWSHQDVIEWILRYPPKDNSDLYKRFVNNVVSLAFVRNNKNPTQSLIYCQDNFEEFLKLHEAQDLKRLEDGPNRDEVAAIMISFKHFIRARRRSTSTAKSTQIPLKMTLNTATLLVAAYFAAFTRPSDDKKNFVKLQKRGQRKTKSNFDNISRPFTLERLYHIYRALQHTTQGNNAADPIFENGSVLGDVERFENLNILIHVSGWSIHPEARFRLSSRVNRDYIDRVAQLIDLRLEYFHGLS